MNNTKKLHIIQYVITALLFIFLVSQLMAGHTKDVKLDAVQKAYKDIEASAELMSGDAKAVKKTFRLDSSSYDWVYYAYNNNLMDVSEILIVRSEQADALALAEAAVQSRINAQKTNFDGYGTNQYDLLCHAVAKQVGDYYIYAVSEEVDKWEEVILDLIK